MIKKILILVFTLLFLFAVSVQVIGSEQSDWPMYAHNPANTGYSPSIAPETNTTFLAKQLMESSGLILESPIVADGKLYIASAQGTLLCADAYTGENYWEKELGNFPSTPAVVDGFIYIGNSTGLHCYIASIEDPGDPEWTFACESIQASLTVIDDKIYFGGGNKLYCVNTDGREDWNVSVDYNIYSTPAVVENKVYFASSNTDASVIYCLDVLNHGTELWRYERNTQTKTSPAIANGKVYIGSWDTILCLNVTNDDGEDSVVPLWEFQTIGYPVTSAAVADNKTYFGSTDNTIYCTDANTGAELWRYAVESYMQAPAVADGKVYVCSFEGTVYCLDATDTGYGIPTLIWSYTTGNAMRNQPAIGNGRVWVIADNYYSYGFFDNQPPETPDQPYGVSNGKVGIECTYTTTTIDSDGVEIWYKWDFEDEETDWLGPYNSGESIQKGHIWTSAGIYNVQVRAKDGFDEMSSWSAPFTVEISTEDEEDKGWFYGIVTDNSGHILDDVRVCVINLEEESQCDYTTDEQGLYQIHISAGSYTVEASKNGYETTTVSDITVTKNGAIEVDFKLEKIEDETKIDSDEKILAEYTVQNAIDAGHVGAIINVLSTDKESEPAVEYYSDQYEIEMEESKEIIKFTVSAEEDTPGRFFIIFIDEEVLSNSEIKVTYDGVEIGKMSISYFLNPQEIVDPGYVMLSTKEGHYVGVYVPHFSEHTITIKSVIEGIGGISAILFYLVIIGIIGIIYVVPIWFVQRK